MTKYTAYFWGNVTKGVQDSNKGALTVDSGRRAGVGMYKAIKDFYKRDLIFGSLCCILIGCETISGKIVTVSALKATSMGCQKFRDLCVVDPYVKKWSVFFIFFS